MKAVSVFSQEEVEKVWKELEQELRKVSPLVREQIEYINTQLMLMSSYREEVIKTFEEFRKTYQQFIPQIPRDVWSKVILIARNLGQPISVVLGDLVAKAVSKDPSELAEYRIGFSERMRSKGEELLREEDIVQASEKFWNAVVQAIKAIATQEGLELRTHADLWNYINALAKRHGDIEFARLFAECNYLHRNFYEGDLLPELVREYIESAKKLIKKLRELIKT